MRYLRKQVCFSTVLSPPSSPIPKRDMQWGGSGYEQGGDLFCTRLDKRTMRVGVGAQCWDVTASAFSLSTYTEMQGRGREKEGKVTEEKRRPESVRRVE